MGAFLVQQSFSHGEMGPRVIARNDITLYSKCAKRLREVVVIPEGGARRRFGTNFLIDVFKHAPLIPNVGEYNLLEFQFSETENFIGIILDSSILMFDSDGNFINFVVTPYSGSEIKDINFSQSTNLMIFAHPDYSPRQMSYDTTTNMFVFTTIAFTFVPPNDRDWETFISLISEPL